MSGGPQRETGTRLALAVVLVLGGLTASGPSLAHSRLPGLLVLQEHAPEVWDVRLELPPAVGSGVVLHPPDHCTVDETLSLQRWTCPEGLRGRTLAASGLAAHAIDLLVRTEPLEGGGSTGLLHAGAPEWTVPASPAGAGAMVGHGLRHILGGIDHLLFLLGLTVWIGPRARALLGAITAFTVGHSLSLAAMALGLLVAPAASVEAVIALSILFLAVELRAPERVNPGARRAAAIAVACGLVHGLGFGGALLELDLDPAARPLALLGFNLGVELGQLGVLAAFGLVAWVLVRLLPSLGGALVRLVPWILGISGACWFWARTMTVFAP